MWITKFPLNEEEETGPPTWGPCLPELTAAAGGVVEADKEKHMEEEKEQEKDSMNWLETIVVVVKNIVIRWISSLRRAPLTAVCTANAPNLLVIQRGRRVRKIV